MALAATAVLVTASVEVDKTGASYYGEQTLHYLATNGETAVVQLREYCTNPKPLTLTGVRQYSVLRLTLRYPTCNQRVLADAGVNLFVALGVSQERADLRRGLESKLLGVLRSVRLHAGQSHRLQPQM